jgi:hypothetical protein
MQDRTAAIVVIWSAEETIIHFSSGDSACKKDSWLAA